MASKKSPINRLHTRLLVQCIADAKLNNCPNYGAQLSMPDSYLRIMIGSIATVMDRELRNLAKRMSKKIDARSQGIPMDGPL